jgi:hypothetical protein
MKTLTRLNEKSRCWKGYKPTPGKKPFSKDSCMKEATQLKGNQHKLDKNSNGRLDSQDFKILRGKKSLKKSEGVVEGSPAWQRKEGKNPEGGLNAKGVA